MATHRRTTRTTGAAAALLGAALVLGACSDTGNQQASDTVAQQQAEQYEAETVEQEAIERRHAALPPRPAGIVELDGAPGASLTPAARDAFFDSGSAVTVEVSEHGEDVAFQQLCAGEIDLVDSARPISRAEWDACRSVGLDVVQFQIAADAVVLAIKSESDVGGDCLTTEQVRDVYRAGSPVMTWAQLGLDDVPLAVGGPDADASGFSFFGRNILDAPQPGLTNLRSDYHAFASDQGSRIFVVGRDRDERLALEYGDHARERDRARSELVTAQQVLDDAQAEVVAAEAERAKGIRDQRPLVDQQRDEARKQAAYVARDAARVVRDQARAKARRIQARFVRSRDARRREELVRGHVAYFRFSYYELFEDQLRPFEITEPTGERNCIFPSQHTITSGEYPLARQLLITTTTRSLERREVRSFLETYLDRAGRLAADSQLVPLPETSISVQRAWLTGDAPPVLVTPDEETVLQPARQSGSSEQPAR